MTSSFPTAIEMSEQVKYCGIAQPSWTMISPTDQCLMFSRRKRESQLISSNIKALSIQSTCKPEKRTRSRARTSFDTQESTCVIAMAKTNENRTLMCWNMKRYCPPDDDRDQNGNGIEFAHFSWQRFSII